MSDPYNTGDVLDYPYLWDWQYQRGETEGRKDRPCCVTLVVPLKNGQTRLYLLPITTTEPAQGEPSLEVPEIEAKRAGLDLGVRKWVMLSEWNADLLDQSFYLDRRQEKRGSFSKPFLDKILMALRPLLASRALSTVRRDEG